jgi:hypothetical protein
MASSLHIVGSQGGAQVGPPAPLSTPCTLMQLHAWLDGLVTIVGAGGTGTVTITTTSSTMTAA